MVYFNHSSKLFEVIAPFHRAHFYKHPNRLSLFRRWKYGSKTDGQKTNESRKHNWINTFDFRATQPGFCTTGQPIMDSVIPRLTLKRPRLLSPQHCQHRQLCYRLLGTNFTELYVPLDVNNVQRAYALPSFATKLHLFNGKHFRFLFSVRGS